MTSVARWLRWDHLSWARFAATSTAGAAALTVVGAFAMVAWDRFGFQALSAPRASMRILLVGSYGWLGLAIAVWLLGRSLDLEGDFRLVLTLYGLAHLPVVLVALVAQFTGVLLDFTGPGWVVAGFAALLWMPGQLIAATRESFAVDTRRAAALCLLPYVAWLAVVGGATMRQVGHLL